MILIFYTKSFFCKVSRRGMPYPIVNPLGSIHYTSKISVPSLYWCWGYELPRISKSRRHLLYKNILFWILIFLLCQKFDLLSPSQKYWSRSKSWAQSKFLKLDLNWNLFGNGSIGKFCKTQCYGRKNQLFQDLIFLPGSKFDELSQSKKL